MKSSPAYDQRAEIYDCFFGDRTSDINGWFRLAGLAGPRVVEWMCGTGVRKLFVRNKYNAQQRLYTIHDKVAIDKDGQIRELEYQFAMRHFTPEEISGLLLESEFDDVRMFGDWDLNPWYKGAPEWIVRANKSWKSEVRS